MTTVPASGASNPATRRNSVVLPHPDGPSSVRNSPARTSSVTSRTASTPPKAFRRPCNDTAPRTPESTARTATSRPRPRAGSARQLLQRVLELLQHLVHERARDVERGLDADGLGVEERARHQ